MATMIKVFNTSSNQTTAPPLELNQPNSTLQFTELHKKANDGTFETLPLENSIINQRDILEWTPLHYAGFNPKSESRDYTILSVVQNIIDSRADVNAQDVHGLTPLHLACRGLDDNRVIRELLRSGADANMRDMDERTPLHHAAEQGNKQAVQPLIEAGASVNLIDGLGHTPLHWAVYKGHPGLIDDLWSDENKRLRDHNGRTPLHLIAMGGAGLDAYGDEMDQLKEVVKKLDERKADKEAKDRFGQTPLHIAVRSGTKAITEKLLEIGAKQHVTDSEKKTPFHFAVWGGHEDLARLLLDLGADIEAEDAGGMTPLCAAAGMGHQAIVQMLLDADRKSVV